MPNLIDVLLAGLALIIVAFTFTWWQAWRAGRPAHGRPAPLPLLVGFITLFFDTLGIGNYAPTMAMTYMLGMNTRAVFPIMAASASLILPAAALRFYRSGRFDRRAALGFAIGGIPGVLVAAYIVKELPLDAVKWIVVGVLLYTSVTLWMSSRNAASVA